MPRLQAVDTDALAQQFVAVVLSVVVVGKFAFRVIVVELGEILDRPLGQGRQIARRHAVFRMGPARRVAECAVLEPDFAGLFGHHLGEGILAAGQGLGDDDAGIVARLHDYALQQILDADPLARLQEHGRSARGPIALAPSVLTDHELLVEGQAALLQAFEHHVDRHQLAHGRRRHQGVRVLFEQHGAGLAVDQDGLAGDGVHGRSQRRAEHHGSDHHGTRCKAAQMRNGMEYGIQCRHHTSRPLLKGASFWFLVTPGTGRLGQS